MAEHMNGKAPYTRRTSGSERRGAVPVPSFDYGRRIPQTQNDIARVLEQMQQNHALRIERLEKTDLGNKELPAYKHKEELVANIEAYKAVIVGGETGSGKSTQLPQYLYEAGYDMTIMLVPRRGIANGLGERIRDELSCQIKGANTDELVGIVHGERVERHDDNKILVMTPNTFIRMQASLKEQYGDKKLAVVADEIHEANLYTEIAVGVAAMSVQEQENWRLVAASATHNIETLQGPFQKLNNGYVPSVEIEGRPFTVERREEPELTPMQAYGRDGFEHQKAMIFTSGKAEIDYIIEQTRKEIEARQKGASEDVVFRKYHGDLTEVELSHINDPIPEGKRLVIVASPAGMSGITIPGVTYVATDGTINRKEFDDDRADGLLRRVLSKAGVNQQIGRAGRDVPGGVGVICRPVITENKYHGNKAYDDTQDPPIPYVPYEERPDHEPAEIYATNLEGVALSVSALGYDLEDINEYLPHGLQSIDISNAKRALERIGALKAGVITDTGVKMSRFPLTPEISRGLVEASGKGKSLQHMVRAALIAAAIDLGGIADNYAGEEAKDIRKQIVRPTSSDDLMVQLDLMTKLYERTSDTWSGHDFVERHGLYTKRVEQVRKMTRKIFGVLGVRLQDIEITVPQPHEEQELRDDFTAGFLDHLYKYTGRSTRTHQRIYRSIHDGKGGTERRIDDRSSAVIDEKDVLIAGAKRFYIKGKHKDGTDMKHDIVSNVFPVDPFVVGKYAEQNGLVKGKSAAVRMVGDRAVEYQQGVFGSIEVGSAYEEDIAKAPSPEAQNLLFEYVMSRPGKTQRALLRLVDDLADFRNRATPDTLATLRNVDAPEDLTKDDVSAIIKAATGVVHTAHEVEEYLRQYAYDTNASLAKYYSIESLQYLNEISPQYIDVDQQYLQVHYDNGQPYVTGASRRSMDALTEPLYLEDGREVLNQVKIGGKRRRISFGR